MMPVEEALERILSYFSVLDLEELPVLEALGQVVAEDVVARFSIPPLDNTAMDGYAVRASDTAGASAEQPVRLRVVGELAAGYVFGGRVEPNEAVRIMTGAPVPDGADTIVPFEETDEPTGRGFGRFAKSRGEVGILKAAAAGNNIRRAGEDVRSGQRIIPSGTVVQPAQIGVLASLGLAKVRAHRRPVVAILSTGDEVKEPGQPLGPGQIYDSNAYSVSAMVLEAGGIPKRLGIAPDTVEALTAKLREGLNADMLVTSAGVSRGDYDVVKDVLAKEGDVDFWTVRMRPGKPLAFGAFRDGSRRVPHIGLPGNPVSSMVSFELFGRPAIFKMLGRDDWRRPVVRAIADDAIANTDARRVYARAVVTERDGGYHAALTGPQGSGILTSMAEANAFAIVPEDVALVRPGEEVDCMMLGAGPWTTVPRQSE
jgi:molybdopterin molybdotransferase